MLLSGPFKGFRVMMRRVLQIDPLDRDFTSETRLHTFTHKPCSSESSLRLHLLAETQQMCDNESQWGPKPFGSQRSPEHQEDERVHEDA